MTAGRAIIQNRATRAFLAYAATTFVTLQVILHFVYGVGVPIRWQQGAFFVAAGAALAIVLLSEFRRKRMVGARGFEVLAK